eukprot:309426-Alexandrium_andersonii.AAC.1
MSASLVGSEMCIRDSASLSSQGAAQHAQIDVHRRSSTGRACLAPAAAAIPEQEQQQTPTEQARASTATRTPEPRAFWACIN